MGKYIRIKKSKNLRYKLISILYLLFISLSIIQIPIDWLRVSPDMRSTFSAVKSGKKGSAKIESAKSGILSIDETFSGLVGLDQESGRLLQPENYSLSDKFFLNSPHGQELFNQLIEVRDSVQSLASDDPLRLKFEKLFAADLEHGLNQRTAQTWLHWKFLHVPATVARLELSDLILKLNLLLGEFEVNEESQKRNPNFILAFNIDQLHIGDTAFFVYEGDQRPMLDLSIGKNQGQEYVWENDTLIFMALDTGHYHLNFSLGKEQREFNFKVLPANFRSFQNRQDLANYSGLPFQIPLEDWQKELNFSCSCMNGAKPSIKEDQLEIRPMRSGWCIIEAFVKDLKALAFKDSVYIHPLPAPIIYTSGISGNEVSRTRLQRLGQIELKVLFPNQPQGLNFSIEHIKAKLHTRSGSEEKLFENRLRLSESEIESLHYIEIQEVMVRSLDGPLTISDRLIINIIGDEV